MSWIAKKFAASRTDGTVAPVSAAVPVLTGKQTAKPLPLGTSNRFDALADDDEDHKPAAPVAKATPYVPKERGSAPVAKAPYVPRERAAGGGGGGDWHERSRSRGTYAAAAPVPTVPNVASKSDFPALGGKPVVTAAKPALNFGAAAKAAVDLPTPKRQPKPVEPVAPMKAPYDPTYDCYWGDEDDGGMLPYDDDGMAYDEGMPPHDDSYSNDGDRD